jgi:hypothetical protein
MRLPLYEPLISIYIFGMQSESVFSQKSIVTPHVVYAPKLCGFSAPCRNHFKYSAHYDTEFMVNWKNLDLEFDEHAFKHGIKDYEIEQIFK